MSSQGLSRVVKETLLSVLGADVGLETPLLAAGLDSLSGPRHFPSSLFFSFSLLHMMFASNYTTHLPSQALPSFSL